MYHIYILYVQISHVISCNKDQFTTCTKIVIRNKYSISISRSRYLFATLFSLFSLPLPPAWIDEFFSPEFQTIWYRCEEEDTRRRRRRRGRARFHARIPRTSYWIAYPSQESICAATYLEFGSRDLGTMSRTSRRVCARCAQSGAQTRRGDEWDEQVRRVIRGGIGSELMTRKRKAREEDTGLSVKKKKQA